MQIDYENQENGLLSLINNLNERGLTSDNHENTNKVSQLNYQERPDHQYHEQDNGESNNHSRAGSKDSKKNTPESIKTTRVQTEIDELRRREQERRVKEAMENQIDINRQSDLLKAFEEEYF